MFADIRGSAGSGPCQDRGVPALQRFAAVGMYFTMLIFTMLLTTDNAGGTQPISANPKGAASRMILEGAETFHDFFLGQ